MRAVELRLAGRAWLEVADTVKLSPVEGPAPGSRSEHFAGPQSQDTLSLSALEGIPLCRIEDSGACAVRPGTTAVMFTDVTFEGTDVATVGITLYSRRMDGGRPWGEGLILQLRKNGAWRVVSAARAWIT